MCGIFMYNGNLLSIKELITKLDMIKHRGPDNTHYVHENDIFFGFSRLMINGLDNISNQPMRIKNCILICNGEIYNYKKLMEEFKAETHSDCEIICHLYKKYGMQKCCEMLDGEFAFVLYDLDSKKLYIARDHLGVRGLFWDGIGNTVCSEMRALDFCDNVQQFPPRCYWDGELHEYISFRNILPLNYRCEIDSIESILCFTIRELLINAVKKRIINSEKKVGCLLSGGLDSSLTTAIAVRYFAKPSDLHTFSVGMEGSPDLFYARKVANYLGTTHHEYVYNEIEFLNEIEETIKCIESYDTTTVRASVGHRLVAKKVREDTDIKVLLSSDVPDELCPGYRYLANINNGDDLQEECIKLLEELHWYDMLRTDRCISYNGLEARCPFSDKYFIKYYLSIPPEMRLYNNNIRIEKYLLRKAFEGYLPNDVLWRPKVAFSNGVSDKKRDWSIIIKEHVNNLITDDDFNVYNQYIFNKPQMKESFWYRQIFESYFGEIRNNIIPKYWLPNPKYCGNIIDPSARILTTHNE